MRNIYFVLIFLLYFSFIQSEEENIIPLKIYKILPIKSTKTRIEPSGLTFWKGKLVSIDDKTDDTIFQLIIKKDYVEMIPFISLDISEVKRFWKLDFEGITHFNNRLYLVSETYCKVIEVLQDGKARWIELDIRKYGKDRNIFTRRNAGIEGLTSLENGVFLLAVERQPRGLIHIKIDPLSILNYQLLNTTNQKMANSVSPDFAGLYYYKKRIWALFRNKNQIVELAGKPGQYRIIKRYSYAHILYDKKYIYDNMKYGMAEGLAVDDSYFYIVLDNNQIARKNSNGKDRRPLFLMLKRPK